MRSKTEQKRIYAGAVKIQRAEFRIFFQHNGDFFKFFTCSQILK